MAHLSEYKGYPPVKELIIWLWDETWSTVQTCSEKVKITVLVIAVALQISREDLSKF